MRTTCITSESAHGSRGAREAADAGDGFFVAAFLSLLAAGFWPFLALDLDVDLLLVLVPL